MEAYVLYERLGFIPWQTEVEYDATLTVDHDGTPEQVYLLGGREQFRVAVDAIIDVRAKKNLGHPNIQKTVRKWERDKNTHPEGLSTTRSNQEVRDNT